MCSNTSSQFSSAFLWSLLWWSIFPYALDILNISAVKKYLFKSFTHFLLLGCLFLFVLISRNCLYFSSILSQSVSCLFHLLMVTLMTDILSLGTISPSFPSLLVLFVLKRSSYIISEKIYYPNSYLRPQSVWYWFSGYMLLGREFRFIFPLIQLFSWPCTIYKKIILASTVLHCHLRHKSSY